jgi:hypothetical protein
MSAATELQMRTMRRLGELPQLAKGAGQIVEGRPPKVENN